MAKNCDYGILISIWYAFTGHSVEKKTKTGKIGLSDFIKNASKYAKQLLGGSYDRLILQHNEKAALGLVTFKWMKDTLNELEETKEALKKMQQNLDHCERTAFEVQEEVNVSDTAGVNWDNLDIVDVRAQQDLSESQDMLISIREKFPFLDDLNHGDIIEVTKNVAFRELKRGEVVFSQGDTGQEVFYIIKGNVQILLETHETKIPLALMKTTTIFGEMAPITQEPRSATAVASGDTTLLSFEIDHANMRTNPMQFALLYRNFIKILSSKLIIANTRKS